MATEYKQTLLDKRAHDEIKAAKAIMSTLAGKRLSSRDVIEEFLGRRLRYLALRGEIRNYINAFVSRAAQDESVLGVMLFGSVARNNFNNYSDIDLLVAVEGDALGHFEQINRMIDDVERFRKPLTELGMHLRIRPLMLSAHDMRRFRPIYIDLFEEGAVLFERNDALFNFLNEIRKSVDYERKVVNNAVLVKWRIKE